MNSDDALLVQRCLRGEERAYGVLLGRYRRSVYSLIYRMVGNAEEAQDLAQEAFIRAFRSLASYDPQRSFANWLFKIASNLTIDFFRKRRLPTVSTAMGEEEDEGRELDLPDPSPSALDSLVEDEEARLTADLVQSLPEHYRIVVLLRHGQDLTYEEIADALSLPVGTVKARLHRARHMLRDKLEGRGRI
ncbi:MAG TPA: sigma-70 family RNA polymerase sigma factor [Candidatus Saccharimonadales bacterium]|nr:sigma-70 family RNA polymerase sigma factor [Candidatus Saccharimonadales bacterium]